MSLLFEWLENAVQRRLAGAASGHAVIYRDTYLSWRGLLHRVERRAQEFAAMGIQARDWVGLMVGNDPEFVVIALALSKLDAVVVPIDPTTGGRDLDMTIDAAPLRALVTRPYAIDPLAAPSGTLRLGGHAPTSRMAAESRHRISGTLLSCTLYPWTRPSSTAAQDAVVALFALDCGGDPKAVVRGPAQLRGIVSALEETLDLSPLSRVLCAAPLFDSQGFDFGFLAALFQGATLYLDDGAAGPRLAKTLVDQGISLFAATPREFAALARLTNAKPVQKHSAHLVCSGVPLPAPVAHAFRQRFGIPVLSCYHSSETGPAAIDLDGSAPESVGTPFAGVSIRIASSDGAALAPGTIGPVWIRGAGVSTTFLPELPVRAGNTAVGRGVLDGWLRTGDVGHVDRSQRLHLCHREDDIVKVDRRSVALGEIESCLEGLANVKAAQARVEYDDEGSTHIVVQVTPGGRCRPKVMLDHCAKRLAPHKVPSRIEITE
jgi:acyl-CoA synthetase (AMP-forming)/AMP-acid ligase II